MNVNELFSYLKKSFLTGSAKTIFVSAVTLILLPAIISEIGMENYGLVALTMIFGGAVVFVDLGLAKSLVLLLGKTDDEEAKGQLVADAFLLSFIILLILGLALLFMLYLKVPILGNELDISNTLKVYILISGFVTIVVLMINNILTAILESFLLMHYVNVGFGLSSVTFHLMLYIFSMLSDSVYLFVSSPFIAYMIIMFYYIYLIHKKTSLNLGLPNVRSAISILPVSLKFLGLSILSSGAIPLNKYALVLLSGSPIAIGVFDLSLKIAQIATSFLNSIAQPLFGVFSKVKENFHYVFKMARKVSTIIFLMYLSGILVYFFVGDIVAQLLDENNKNILFKSSKYLLVCIAFTSVAEPFYRAFIGLALLKKATVFKSVAILINLLLLVFLSTFDPLNRIVWSYGMSVVVVAIIIIISGLSYKINTSIK